MINVDVGPEVMATQDMSGVFFAPGIPKGTEGYIVEADHGFFSSSFKVDFETGISEWCSPDSLHEVF